MLQEKIWILSLGQGFYMRIIPSSDINRIQPYHGKSGFQWLKKCLRKGKKENQSSRCIYENQDILVQHDVIAFLDGTKEVIIGVHTLKDRKIVKTETGATTIST